MIGSAALSHNAAAARPAAPGPTARSGTMRPFFPPSGREMRLSTYPVNTLRDVPADAEVVSHQLMLRAGLIRRLAGGLYTWLPIGLRVLRKVENIVREEMDRAGAFELLMPTVQPAELWQESGRWDQFGPELLRLKDRHDRAVLLRPDARGSDHRHRAARAQELPPAAGQFLPDPDQVPRRDPAALRRDARARIHDEGRLLVPPRRGLARGGLPGDVPRLHARSSSACSCKFRAVRADTGSIGGSASQEFHVLADSGEDAIAFSDGDDYAANLEMAEALAPAGAARRSDGRRCRRSRRRACAPSTSSTAFLGVDGRRSAEDAAGRRQRGRRRGDGRARRPRTERGQGAEAAGRARRRCAWRAPEQVPRGDRLRAGLPRPGRPAAARSTSTARRRTLADFVCGANERTCT